MKDTELTKQIERTYKLYDEYRKLAQCAAVGDIQVKKEKDVPLLTIDSIKRFFNKHPDFYIETPFLSPRKTLYLICCERGIDIKPITYLLEQGAEINRTDLFGNNALMLLIRNENMELREKRHIIEILINKHIDINWVNTFGETALGIALYEHQTEIAELLIKNGAKQIEYGSPSKTKISLM